MPAKTKRLRLLFPALGLACFGSILVMILRREAIELRWKLTPGQVLKYRFTSSVIIQDDAGRNEQTPVVGDFVAYLSVLDVNAEGVATIFKAEQGPVTKETMTQYKLKPIENPYRMTPRGQVLRDKEVYRQELKRLIREQKPDSLMTDLLETAEKESDQYETVKGLEDFVLPGKPVRPGDEWTISATLKNGWGIFKTTHRYVLRKVDAGIATIAMEQSQELVPGSATEFGATTQFQQVLSREATFSIEKGILIDLRQVRKNTYTILGRVSTTERTEGTTLVP